MRNLPIGGSHFRRANVTNNNPANKQTDPLKYAAPLAKWRATLDILQFYHGGGLPTIVQRPHSGNNWDEMTTADRINGPSPGRIT
jgi:hypothetical protein